MKASITITLLPVWNIKWYEVTVESIESIHNHNAFACVEKGWQP